MLNVQEKRTEQRGGAAMSHTSNCIKMWMILNSRGLVKGKELAEILEVKERMVRKYKEDLEMAGVHIGTKPGRHGGYYLEKNSILPNIDFDTDEINALDVAYEYIENDAYFPQKSAFLRFYHQITTMAVNKKEADQYLYFVNKYKPRDTLTQDNERFLLLRSAIINKTKVQIAYQDHKGNEESRVIRPYGLINYDSNWYCRAYCEKRQAQRTFKVLRIRSLQILKDTFVPEPDFNIREDKLGICDDGYEVELLVQPSYAHILSEAVWGEGQTIETHKDGSVTFRALMFGKVSIVKWIMSMGSHVKAIGPETIREEVKNELMKTLHSY
ncbi:MAG: helix-turn-helix transcriptional regulator [Bacillus sp. (in: firmicutes)]